MKKQALVLLLVFSASSVYSQYRDEVGVVLGGANYLGEMGGDQSTRRDFIWDMKLAETKASAGIYHRHRFNDFYGMTTNLTWARISGSDALSTNPGRNGRNLSFRNDLFELATRFDYYTYQHTDVGNHGRYSWDFRSYAFVGVGATYHNPKALYNGEWQDLRSLKTEGQQKEYSQVAFAIPGGVGMFFTHKRRYRIGMEVGFRTTFTDYLDDVSTTYASDSELDSEMAIALANRHDEIASNEGVPDEGHYDEGEKRGDPSHNDTYVFSHVTFGYVMRGNQVRNIGIRRPRLRGVRRVRAKFVF